MIHLTALVRPLEVKLAGGGEWRPVVAMAWDDETNATRYLVAHGTFPHWVPQADLGGARVASGG